MFKLSKYNYTKTVDDNVYIYNLIYRSFLKLDYESFSKLESSNYDNIDQTSINTLLTYGIICPNDINENLLMKSYFLSKLNSTKSLGIILSMTSLCDFNCSYCFEDCRKKSSKEKTYIDKNAIDTVYEYVLQSISDNGLNNLSMAYFGGEPLFNIENLEYAIEKFSSINGINLSQILITNGYNLSDTFIKNIILKNNVIVQITLDGPKEIHNKFRISKTNNNTYDVIINNLRKICEFKPENCILRINVQEHLAEHYFSLFDFIYEDEILRKIGNINISPIFDGKLKSNCTSSIITDSIINIYKYAINKKLNLSINVEYGPCLYNSRFGLTIDENLNTYTCPGELYKKNVGSIKDRVHIITDNSWYEGIVNFNPCIENCKYAPICYGPCVLNGHCHRGSIEKLLPLFIEQKILKYNI